MRTKFKRFSAVAAVMAPLAMMAASAAPASAAGTACTGESGAMKISPGLTSKAQVQNITVKGFLTGCTGSTVSGAGYVAHLKTTNPVTCATLATAEPATGTIVIKWSPKGQGNSQASLSMPLTSLAETALSGSIASGPFEALGISGTSTTTFGTCNGKAKLKTATVSGPGVVIS